jgi:hypothetical protein
MGTGSTLETPFGRILTVYHIKKLPPLVPIDLLVGIANFCPWLAFWMILVSFGVCLGVFQ